MLVTQYCFICHYKFINQLLCSLCDILSVQCIKIAIVAKLCTATAPVIRQFIIL